MNVLCHQAKVAQNWFEENSEGMFTWYETNWTFIGKEAYLHSISWIYKYLEAVDSY